MQKKDTNKSTFKVLFLCVAKCILIISQYNVFTGNDNVTEHMQLHPRTCCILCDTEVVISSQFSLSGLACYFFNLCHFLTNISVSATAAGPVATIVFVANMREDIGPLSETLTSKCEEALLFP
jgi:hypothetical protein